MECISKFTGEYDWLSNFYQCEVWYEDIRFTSVEQAYQYAKCVNDSDKQLLRLACNATQAKKLGKTVTLRMDWETVKIPIMEKLLQSKFSNATLRDVLISTGDAILVEGNWWHDNFWGSCDCPGCRLRTKHNNLGKMLMSLRGKLRRWYVENPFDLVRGEDGKLSIINKEDNTNG